jgi:hypothetical protein
VQPDAVRCGSMQFVRCGGSTLTPQRSPRLPLFGRPRPTGYGGIRSVRAGCHRHARRAGPGSPGR